MNEPEDVRKLITREGRTIGDCIEEIMGALGEDRCMIASLVSGESAATMIEGSVLDVAIHVNKLIEAVPEVTNILLAWKLWNLIGGRNQDSAETGMEAEMADLLGKLGVGDVKPN